MKLVPKAHKVKQSFSRMEDYAMILLVPVSATLIFMVKHFLDVKNMPRPINYSSWFNQAYAFDTSLWGHFLCLSMLFFGLGSALTLLHFVDRLNDREESYEVNHP